MFYDAALVFDPAAKCADLAIGSDGDLVIDETSLTPVLLSIGLDRRAGPDDPLPDGREALLAPASFSERRGAIGDAFDAAGEFTGSRIWLLSRAKATETTRQLCAYWLEEALDWAERETGTAAEIEVEWRAPEVLAYRVMVADSAVSFSRRLES